MQTIDRSLAVDKPLAAPRKERKDQIEQIIDIINTVIPPHTELGHLTSVDIDKTLIRRFRDMTARVDMLEALILQQNNSIPVQQNVQVTNTVSSIVLNSPVRLSAPFIFMRDSLPQRRDVDFEVIDGQVNWLNALDQLENSFVEMIYYTQNTIIRAESNSLTSPTGTIIVTMSTLVPNLLPENVIIKKDGVILTKNVDYLAFNLTEPSFYVRFLPDAEITASSSIIIEVIKPNFLVNLGLPITVINDIP